MKKKIISIILILVLLWLFSTIIASLFSKDYIDFKDKIIIIPIKGTITVEGTPLIPFSVETTSSTKIVDNLKQAYKDKSVKGIILEINSPGGTVVATEEIANTIKESNKPVVAWIREIGASGAYWIASSSDLIVADPLSITGSIGVASSYLEFSDLFEEYGITYERLNAGKYKDIGTPYKKLTPEERSILQKKLDLIHKHFIDEITNNRNINKKTITELSTGIFYLGKEAKNLNLIDYLGGKELAINLTKKKANITEAKIVKYTEKTKLSDLISRLSARAFYFMGRGIGYELYAKSKNSFIDITI